MACLMSRLNTATSFHSKLSDEETSSVKVLYKTGASFVGSVQDYKKIGSGVFTWPDGSRYDGDYVNNLRHGHGNQTWADGTQYEGGFVNDLRYGEGSLLWTNGETYKGAFFKDRRHGKGTYTWPNSSTFNGSFFMDKKEGYGTFSFANGNKFEGLYKDDEREGPGVLSYRDGRQDVGFWHGEQLLKLLTAVPDAFSMRDHPEFEYQPEDMTIPIQQQPELTSSVKSVLEPPSLFNYAPEVRMSDRMSELYSEDLDPRSCAVNRQAFDDEFFKDTVSSAAPEQSCLEVWNKSPMLVKLQLHVYKHRKATASLDFDIDKVLNFDRSGFKPAGPLEQASEELIKMATAGNFLRVEELLNCGSVHADVADKEGHTALIGATVNWHLDTINVLLNHGADMNQLNDEGVSCLAAGTIFYYPVESFLYNIAERYMEKPPTLEDTRSEISHSPTRSVQPLSSSANSPTKTERRATQLNQLNRKKSEMAALRFSKERTGSADIIENVSEKQDAPKVVQVDSTLPLLRQRSPVKVTVAADARTLLYNEEEQQEIEYIAPMKKDDDDRDSVLDGGEVMTTEGEVEGEEEEGGTGEGEETAREREREDFESNKSVLDYQIEVTDTLVERCATQLSMNERVVSRQTSLGFGEMMMGKARMLAIQISQHERMKDTLELLLRRGANPNASRLPMPVLFFAIKAADVDMVRTLLVKGASTSATLSHDKGGLAPLHISAAIPGEEGVAIMELLLDALADPDVRAQGDDSFLNTTLEEEWSKDVICPESAALLGGRTPLQIACARDDNYKHACKVVQLLLKHKANPDLICNGFSPLALAITSGNDLAVDELLLYGADPSLPLTHGVGNVLCVASSTDYEHRRPITSRIQLIDQLVRAGADMLAPVAIGPKRVTGTAVDYAYYKFNQDRRIAHMPYHALTHAERETYNARRRLLAHVGDILRMKAVEREKKRLIAEEERGVRSASPSPSFVFVGAGAPLPPGAKGKFASKAGQVTFEPGAKDARERKRGDSAKSGSVRSSGVMTIQAGSSGEVKRLARQMKPLIRKPLFKYCYDCGRSVGVRLAACTRCKEVFYCSKACKLKAWNARHKEECIRVGGRSPSPREGRGRKVADSPTPASHMESKDRRNLRINDGEDPGGIEVFLTDKSATDAPASGSKTEDGSGKGSGPTEGHGLEGTGKGGRPMSAIVCPKDARDVYAHGTKANDGSWKGSEQTEGDGLEGTMKARGPQSAIVRTGEQKGKTGNSLNSSGLKLQAYIIQIKIRSEALTKSEKMKHLKSAIARSSEQTRSQTEIESKTPEKNKKLKRPQSAITRSSEQTRSQREIESEAMKQSRKGKVPISSIARSSEQTRSQREIEGEALKKSEKVKRPKSAVANSLEQTRSRREIEREALSEKVKRPKSAIARSSEQTRSQRERESEALKKSEKVKRPKSAVASSLEQTRSRREIEREALKKSEKVKRPKSAITRSSEQTRSQRERESDALKKSEKVKRPKSAVASSLEQTRSQRETESDALKKKEKGKRLKSAVACSLEQTRSQRETESEALKKKEKGKRLKSAVASSSEQTRSQNKTESKGLETNRKGKCPKSAVGRSSEQTRSQSETESEALETNRKGKSPKSAIARLSKETRRQVKNGRNIEESGGKKERPKSAVIVHSKEQKNVDPRRQQITKKNGNTTRMSSHGGGEEGGEGGRGRGLEMSNECTRLKDGGEDGGGKTQPPSSAVLAFWKDDPCMVPLPRAAARLGDNYSIQPGSEVLREKKDQGEVKVQDRTGAKYPLRRPGSEALREKKDQREVKVQDRTGAMYPLRRPQSAPPYGREQKQSRNLRHLQAVLIKVFRENMLMGQLGRSGEPAKGLSRSAYGASRGRQLPPLGTKIDSRGRPQSGHAGGAGGGRGGGSGGVVGARKMFRTEDGRLVYLDNYSFE